MSYVVFNLRNNSTKYLLKLNPVEIKNQENNLHTVNPSPVQLTAFPCKSIPTGKTCFHYRGTLFSLQGPFFHYRVFPVFPFKYFPVRNCSVVFCYQNCSDLLWEKKVHLNNLFKHWSFAILISFFVFSFSGERKSERIEKKFKAE